MATLVLRAGKGSPLTNAEVDANFTNLNTEVAAAALTASWTGVTGKPATLAGYGITDAQPVDADLTAIAALAGTSGFLKKTAANTWSLDTNTYLTGITSGQVTTALGFTPYNATNPSGYTTNTGTVTSVAVSVPTGLSVAGSPITTSGTVAISLASGYSIPTTASQTTWDTASTERRQWDGGATNLVAATARTSLGLVIGTNVQAWDADLDAIAALAGTTGFLKKTAANTWALDTSAYLTGNQSISFTGDATGSGTTSVALTLANSGVTAGTYRSVTVDAKGRVTTGSNPTTLSSYGITDAINVSQRAVANGVATLDGAGLVPASQLPSYVDDVLEYANLAGFPATGETGKIYVAIDTNKTYRWSGTTYIYITSGAVDSVAGKTGVVTLVKGDVGLGSVDNTADSAKNVLSATKLTTARTIGGVSFDGTANINLPGVNAAGNQSTSGNAASATVLQTARTINGVSFNGSANVSVTTAGTGIGVSGTAVSIAAAYSPNTSTELPVADLNTYQTAGFYHQTANADTSTANNYPVAHAGSLLIQRSAGITQQYQTHGTSDTELYFRSFYNTVWGSWRRVLTSANYNSFSPTLTGTGASGTWGISITGNAATVTNGLVSTGSYADPVWLTSVNYSKLTGTVPTWNQSTTGNAASATVLQTARTINGVSFNGSANITVADATKLPLAGGTISGTLNVSMLSVTNAAGGEGGEILLARPITTSLAGAVVIDVQTNSLRIFENGGTFRGAGLDLTGCAGIAGSAILHSNNYNSYAPTLTGTGASGTWGISVTGNAATVTNGVYTTGDQSIAGIKTFTGQVSVPDGTASAPGIRFSGDTDTGIYRVGTNTLGITTGGTQAAYFDASGNTRIVGVLGVAAATPNASIAIYSAISLSANATRYGSLNALTITPETLTADRAHYGAYNRVLSSDQNSVVNAESRAYGAWNEAVAHRTTTNLGAGNSLDGEGQIVGAYNYVALRTSDSTFNRMEAAYGSVNVVDATAGSVSLSVATTSGSTTATINGSGQTTAMIRVGDFITTNDAIPAGTTVASIQDATTFTLSAAATITQTDTSTTFAFATSYIDNAYGSQHFVTANYTGATVNNAYGSFATIRPTATGATINNGYLFYGTNSTVTGTFTNRYGLYIASAINNYVAGGMQVGGTALGGTSAAGLGVNAQPAGAGTITMTGQLTNTVATGTAPFVVTSTTRVANLNVATAGNADTVTNGVYQNSYGSFQAAFTSNIDANTNRNAGVYGSYAFAATNTPTTSGILWNGTSGATGSGDGSQIWQDYQTNNLYARQRWGSTTWSSWLAILSASNFNSYSPTLTGTGASGSWGISVTGNAATVTNGVYTTGDQTIAGVKTFSSPIVSSGTFNINGSVGNDQPTGLYVADLGTTQGTTLNPIATAAIMGQVVAHRSVGFTSDGTYIYGFRSHSTASTYTWHSRVKLADTLATARTIGGVSFDGSANINLPGVNAAGNQNTTGNAATATALQTARTINGTSFNGSANITTANWGTARTLTIGSTGKSVNGSANVSWTLAEVTGTAAAPQFGSVGVGTAASGTTGEIRATNNITAYFSSDRKWKENIRPIENALDVVEAVGGKLFDWTDEYITERGGEDGYFVRKQDFGVVAQDLQEVFPLAVRERPDGSLAVDYEKLCALAFAAIAELRREVRAQ